MRKLLMTMAALAFAAQIHAVTFTIDQELSDHDTLVFDMNWGDKPTWHYLGRPAGGGEEPYYFFYTDWGGFIELTVMRGPESLFYAGPDQFTVAFDDENDRSFVGSRLVASERLTPLDGNFAAHGARFIWGEAPEGDARFAAVPDAGGSALLLGIALLGVLRMRRA